MSDSHDHKHNHGDHHHDHGDHHHHDHDHAHDHGHGNKPVEPTVPAGETAVEDSGSRALAEALRSSFAIVKVIMILLALVFFGSGIFTVSSQEKAIVLRFGKPTGTGAEQLLGPGIHWSFPYPIDEVVRIPISEIQTARSTAGWYLTSPEAEATGNEPEPGNSLTPGRDGYALTSDGNIIHVRAELRYRISDPLNYLLNFTQASNVVQNILDNSIFFAASQFTVDQALTSDKMAFQEKVLARCRQLVEDRKLGIFIEQSDVRVIPPRQTKIAFDNALAAEIDRRKALDEANAYAGRIVGAASGEAQMVINSAKTDRARLVEAVGAEARYFKDQLPHFKNNPQLFAQRIQTETISRVMTNAQRKILVQQRADGKPQELRLQFNDEPVKPVAPKDQQAAQQQNR